MKVNGPLLAIAITLFTETALVLGRTTDTRDLVAASNHGSLLIARGKGGSSGNGKSKGTGKDKGSGSGSSGQRSQVRSKMKKTSTQEDAVAELQGWKLRLSEQEPYTQPSSEIMGPWEHAPAGARPMFPQNDMFQFQIFPDANLATTAGTGLVHRYAVDTIGGTTHVSQETWLDPDPNNPDNERHNGPVTTTNKRSLIRNELAYEEMDPANVRQLGAKFITNRGGRQAFEMAYDAAGQPLSPNPNEWEASYLRVQRYMDDGVTPNPVWNAWDNDQPAPYGNPFSQGVRKLVEEYPEFESDVSGVYLAAESDGDNQVGQHYHAMHTLEPKGQLQKRLAAGGPYFLHERGLNVTFY
ncbi:hypothetical protein B0H66DRAFT_538952 [Apodospora peruviana]|uniref:Uncharacterized protein n=1 Tax=Apodospora peruviana TaxID=516989 RepID=A0AAE0HSF2_9PEZI|nr:hypothetical protein B0H66DRAFT_538952 [Apodospora peruviana]